MVYRQIRNALPSAVLFAFCLATAGCPGSSKEGAPAPDAAPDLVAGEPDIACRATACGNGFCELECGEHLPGASFCQADCCVCGDGNCQQQQCGEAWEEGNLTCASDCAGCGNGSCDPGEGPDICPEDCCGSCGDGVCKGGECGENALACPSDCGSFACGNASCEPGENPVDCPEDCQQFACGNQTCEPGESADSCPEDCAASCGNCECEGGESYSSCPIDCGFCGDGYCIEHCPYIPESAQLCFLDCCEPDCQGKECGPDGCGGQCGQCAGGNATCSLGLCICNSDCIGKVCGPDGCNGVCGECGEGEQCLMDGSCLCSDSCKDHECGPNVCGLDCGACPEGYDCLDGSCTCDPHCDGLECGEDGCGGLCGMCSNDQKCFEGVCLCITGCEGKECGADGCGGSCGECPGDELCLQDGSCLCFPGCEGKQCGDDGCGGSCGDCQFPTGCDEDGGCTLCLPDCSEKQCGDDGCGGSCGQCPEADLCLADGSCQCYAGCEGKICGDGDCGEWCGVCPDELTCTGGVVCLGQDDACHDANGWEWDGCTGGKISEFLVTTTVEHGQLNPDVASFKDDSYVVVWQSWEQDGEAGGIFGRPFDFDGNPLGGEFQVNTTEQLTQDMPRVATFENGHFLVVWESFEEIDQRGVFGQLYWANGVKNGPELHISSDVYADQASPSIAVVGGDTAVVAWVTCPVNMWPLEDGQDGDGCGVFGRIYDEQANAAGPEFQLTSNAAGDQTNADVAGVGATDFVVAWTSPDQDAGGVFARRFDVAGLPKGGEFQVNSWAQSEQRHPAVVDLGEGNFSVVFYTDLVDNYGYGIGAAAYAYESLDSVWGGDVLVNSYEDEHQWLPTATALPGGKIAAVWMTGGMDGDGYAVAGNIVGADGVSEIPDFLANVYSESNQDYPRVAPFSTGGFIVVWESYGQDGHDVGIFAQRFDAAGVKLYR